MILSKWTTLVWERRERKITFGGGGAAQKLPVLAGASSLGVLLHAAQHAGDCSRAVGHPDWLLGTHLPTAALSSVMQLPRTEAPPLQGKQLQSETWRWILGRGWGEGWMEIILPELLQHVIPGLRWKQDRRGTLCALPTQAGNAGCTASPPPPNSL